jgi:hypothetical protein
MPRFIRYKRINKRVARQTWDAGGVVHIQSCKFMFNHPWQPAYQLPTKAECDEREAHHAGTGWTFDALVNNYESYNCSYEQGYYAHFYVPNEEDER